MTCYGHLFISQLSLKRVCLTAGPASKDNRAAGHTTTQPHQRIEKMARLLNSKTIVKWIEIVTNYILHLKKSNFLKSKALSVVFTYCYCFNDLRIADVILTPCLSPLDFWNIECHSIFFQFRNIKFKKSKNQFDFEIDFCRLHRQ